MAQKKDKKRILIVEDDERIALVVKSRLQAAGYDVILASEGGEGLNRALSEEPDLILLDVRMPGVDGWTFLNNFRQSQAGKKIPVIVTTAQAKLKELFGREGVSDYITKPYTPEELLTKIRSVLEQTAETS